MCSSYHYSKDRQVREKVINEMIGNGKIIKTTTMQEPNRSFPATYQISDTGIVTILDVSMTVIITKIIASPRQLRRYYQDEPLPDKLLQSAINNVRKGYNLVQKKQNKRITERVERSALIFVCGRWAPKYYITPRHKNQFAKCTNFDHTGASRFVQNNENFFCKNT